MKNVLEKVKALSKFTGTDVQHMTTDGDSFEVNDVECGGCACYYVYTDEEADQAVQDYIKRTTWVSSPSFIAEHTGIDKSVIEMLQEKCEDANEPLQRLIISYDKFIEEALSSDGRGHFISQYDGQEHEQGEFYIYQAY